MSFHKKLIFLSVVTITLAVCSPNAAAQSYSRYSSYWTTSNGFQSSIKLHNHNIGAPINIEPTLYLANGTPVKLARIQLGPLENSEIDVNTELRRRNLPEGNGSALFLYSGPALNVLAAETLVTNSQLSLAYTIPSYEQRQASTVQRYVYSRPSTSSDVYVSLQNTTGAPLSIRPTLQFGDRTINLDQISLRPMNNDYSSFLTH